MPEPLLIKAFQGTNTRVPVWFMRQAGRYLPEYQAIRKKHSLEEMFTTPELADEITCQPVSILGVDAAVLFADILTLPAAMGVNIRFDVQKGPVIDTKNGLKNLRNIDRILHIEKTVQLVNQKLPADIPLIGFAGSPFTVLTYLIEGGSSVRFSKTFRFMQEEEAVFHAHMEKLTENTIRYLNIQKKAGIQIFQLFDTWAGILRPADYAHFVLPYVQRVFREVDLPSIYYVKDCGHLLALMDKSGADFLSVCHTVVLGHQKTLERTQRGIQGNLFNGLLYADHAALEKEVNDVLIGAQKHKRFIFNLSHGVFPDVSVETLKFIVELVHTFPWSYE